MLENAISLPLAIVLAKINISTTAVQPAPLTENGDVSGNIYREGLVFKRIEVLGSSIRKSCVQRAEAEERSGEN